MSGKLYIGNVNENVRKSELRQEFEKFGEVSDLYVSSGYAFLSYSDSRDASAAIRHMDGELFFGSKLRVELAQEDRRPRGYSPSPHARRGGGYRGRGGGGPPPHRGYRGGGYRGSRGGGGGGGGRGGRDHYSDRRSPPPSSHYRDRSPPFSRSHHQSSSLPLSSSSSSSHHHHPLSPPQHHSSGRRSDDMYERRRPSPPPRYRSRSPVGGGGGGDYHRYSSSSSHRMPNPLPSSRDSYHSDIPRESYSNSPRSYPPTDRDFRGGRGHYRGSSLRGGSRYDNFRQEPRDYNRPSDRGYDDDHRGYDPRKTNRGRSGGPRGGIPRGNGRGRGRYFRGH